MRPKGRWTARRRPNAEQIWFKAADGSRVEAWWFPAKSGRGPAVLFLHGNSDYVETKIEYGDFYQREGVSALLLEYRGYRRSQGRPTEAALRQDALAAYDWLARRADVDPRRIVVHGASLGGAVAAATAAARPARALILQGAFTSLPDMFGRFGVPGLLARDRFDTLAAVRAYKGPVLIFHGDRDEIVPYDHATRLAAAAGARAQLSVVACADHDLPLDWPSFAVTMVGFLREQGVVAATGDRAPG